MNEQVIDLGFILRQIPDYEFSMREFGDRLRLQKTLYLLQAFGVKLGYDFSWYIHGPYCSVLASTGFALEEIYEDIPDEKTEFKKRQTQKKFKDFLGFIKKKTLDDLEIAASIHYLKQIGDLGNEEIIDKVEKKKPEFQRPNVEKMFTELKKKGLVN